MEIINQQTFFIKYEFFSMKEEERMTSSQKSRARRGLIDFFQQLHTSNLDIGTTEQRFFFLIDMYKSFDYIENSLKDCPTVSGRKRRQKVQIIGNIMFQMKWMGSILDIAEATQRIVNIAENMRKRFNIPTVEVFLGDTATSYKGIKEP